MLTDQELLLLAREQMPTLGLELDIDADVPAVRAGLLKMMRAAVAAERERCSTLPRLPTPRLLASGTIAGKHIELHGWHTEDMEVWQRQHGLKFGA